LTRREIAAQLERTEPAIAGEIQYLRKRGYDLPYRRLQPPTSTEALHWADRTYRACERALAEAREDRRSAVRAALDSGMSYAQVAEVLAVSRGEVQRIVGVGIASTADGREATIRGPAQLEAARGAPRSSMTR
jgi:DNA-directed RNA polymerase specialized sigma24 family protein